MFKITKIYKKFLKRYKKNRTSKSCLEKKAKKKKDANESKCNFDREVDR